jgi:hypothetical protein
MSNKVIMVLRDEDGGEEFLVHGVKQAGGAGLTTVLFDDPRANFSVTGLLLTTVGVTDSANKRFMTDAQETAFDAAVVTIAAGERLLGTVDSVNANSSTPTLLYTVPAGKKAVITRVVVRKSSVNLTTADLSFGYNGPATYNDVIATSTYKELTGATLYRQIFPKSGAILGSAGDLFKVMFNVLQGAPATLSIDVFGYVY